MNVDQLETPYLSVLQKHRDFGIPISFMKAGQTKEEQDLEKYYKHLNVTGSMGVTDPETCCCVICSFGLCFPLCLFAPIINCLDGNMDIRGYVQGIRRKRYVLFKTLIVKLEKVAKEDCYNGHNYLTFPVKITEKVELLSDDTLVSSKKSSNTFAICIVL